MDTMSEIMCRLCLRKGLSLIDVFEENIEQRFIIKEAIEDLLNFEVHRKPGLPWVVCPICCAKLDDFRNFKIQCLKSNNTFQSKLIEHEHSVEVSPPSDVVDVVDVKVEPGQEIQEDFCPQVAYLPIQPDEEEPTTDDQLPTKMGCTPDVSEKGEPMTDVPVPVKIFVNTSPVLKHKRKSMSLAKKKEVLDKLAAGRRVIDVAREYGVNESTVRSIRRNKKSIEVSLKGFTSTIYYIRSKANRSVQQNMTESLLKAWIEEQTQKGVALTGGGIREKAQRIYEIICEQEGEPIKHCQFSGGWWYKFKQRTNLQNIKFYGDTVSLDYQAADQFKVEFLKVIKENSYHPYQVFNADETVLFWKRLPSRTYISREEKVARGFKAAKDCLSLLFCSNASGDFKCKPMLVYHSETPRALKHKDKSQLPIVWRSNKKAWVTAGIFSEWFTSYFVPEVRDYLVKRGSPFKVLLVVDDAPCHSSLVSHNINPNVQVMLMPPCTTAILQPLDQGTMKTFKCNYMRRMMRKLFAAGKENPRNGISEYWRNFNIGHAITDIQLSWEDVHQSMLSVGWEKLWVSIVNNSQHDSSLVSELEEIVMLARAVGGEGFSDMKEEEIEEFLCSSQEELTEEELVQVLQSPE